MCHCHPQLVVCLVFCDGQGVHSGLIGSEQIPAAAGNEINESGDC